MLRRNPLPRGNNSRNFLTRNRTDMVKGIAAVAIVVDHFAARSFDAAGSDVLHVYLKGLASMGGIGVILFFFISGFGSFQAMERAKNKTIWLVNHVVSIIIIYLLCYISHIITYEIVTAGTYPIVINDILLDWIHLRAALTTAWYVRIQLLVYVFLYLTSPVSRKNVRILLLILLCLGQSILFWRMGFTANWWKSTLCFSLGAAVAVYRREIYSLFVDRRKSFLIASVLVLPFSYVLSLKIDVYAVKVIANVFLCMSLVSLIELIMPKKNFFQCTGQILPAHLSGTRRPFGIFWLTICQLIKWWHSHCYLPLFLQQ